MFRVSYIIRDVALRADLQIETLCRFETDWWVNTRFVTHYHGKRPFSLNQEADLHCHVGRPLNLSLRARVTRSRAQ